MSKVKIKHYLNPDVEEGSFSLDEVNWEGKITARGEQNSITLPRCCGATDCERFEKLVGT